jgi:regulator of protease activity HflC (stomatin/prohibitin superfamily)
VIRNAIANYNAAEVISTQRGELQAEIVQVLTDELAANNIILLDVLLRDIRIPDSITQAIEEKQAAEQQIEVETNRREQSRIAAERVVIQAEGERDAEIARAQGEAEALRLRGQAIRENPEIIQLEVAQKLAPSLQTILLPAEGNFLLDLRSLTERQAP